MDDYISREAAIDALERTDWYHQAESKNMVHGANSAEEQAWYKEQDVYAAINSIPAADVAPVGLLEQVEWERDTALAQLAEIGKSLGEKMDDVRPVVRGKWKRVVDFTGVEAFGVKEIMVVGWGCNVCGYEVDVSEESFNYCPNCGADMREKT